MDFKSQIATSRSQAQRLLALGLKPETADMVYHHSNSIVKQLEWELETKPPTLRGKFWTPERIAKLKSPLHKHPDGTPMTGEEIFDSIWGQDVPAWSVGRLLEMIPEGIKVMKSPQTHLWLIPVIQDVPKGEIQLKSRGASAYATVGDGKNLIDACICLIQKLIQNNQFNKEFINYK